MDGSNFYYYAIFLTQILHSFAFLPLVNSVYETQYTGNIPYATLYMLLLAALIQIVVALYKGYYIHFIIFTVLFASIGYLIHMKFQFDSNQV